MKQIKRSRQHQAYLTDYMTDKD